VLSATTARRGRQSRVGKNWVLAGIHKIAMKRNLWVFVLGRSCWAVTACLGAAGRVCEPDPSFRCRTLGHLEGGPADPGSRNRPAPPVTAVLGSGGGHSPGRSACSNSPASPASAGPKPDVSSGVLLAASGLDRDDPTGMIACPKPCNVGYAAAYSVYTGDITQYAASWEDRAKTSTSCWNTSLRTRPWLRQATA
jgi:hypothetical protein